MEEKDFTSGIDYRQEMRDFVIKIAACSRTQDPDFIAIPQNGQELLTENGEAEGNPSETYIDAIDGVGREDLFYGYEDDNKPTPRDENEYMIGFLDVALDNEVTVLVTDYCSNHNYMDKSYSENHDKGYISFASDHRELDNIPDYPKQPYNSNELDIVSLNDAQNFLYLINPGEFSSRNDFLDSIRETDYDIIILDAFYDESPLTAEEVESLKTKSNGGQRLVIAYMSIGEAEDYRYYWQDRWNNNEPSWIEEENPYWEGNYKVRYWESGWQEIIYGSDEAYLQLILDAGYDGVYLDLIDSFEYFEEND